MAWVPRSFNANADFYSKICDYDDWRISNVLFDKIKMLTNLTFTVDVFATSENCKTYRFYSRFYSKKCLGVNAFNFDWENEVVWAVPPPSVGLRTVLHFISSGCKGVIILPFWPGQSYWPILGDEEFKKFIVKK